MLDYWSIYKNYIIIGIVAIVIGYFCWLKHSVEVCELKVESLQTSNSALSGQKETLKNELELAEKEYQKNLSICKEMTDVINNSNKLKKEQKNETNKKFGIDLIDDFNNRLLSISTNS